MLSSNSYQKNQYLLRANYSYLTMGETVGYIVYQFQEPQITQ